MRKVGYVPFGLWALPGLVLGLQVSTIGVLLIPVGLAATLLLVKFTRVWPEVLGLFEGVALICFLVTVLNAGYWTCPPSGEVVTRTQSSVTYESCGSLNPWPWLIIGTVSAVGGAVAYAAAARRRPPLDGDAQVRL